MVFTCLKRNDNRGRGNKLFYFGSIDVRFLAALPEGRDQQCDHPAG